MLNYFLSVGSITLGVIGCLLLFLGWGFRGIYLRDLSIDRKIAFMKGGKRKEVSEEDTTGFVDHFKRTYFKLIGVGFFVLFVGLILFFLKG